MSALNPADAVLLERLSAALGPGGVVPAEPRYLEEPRGRFAGRAAAVLRPASTEAVAAAVAICAEARTGIIPYSGGTGLVGGQVMGEGPLPVVLSFERMNRIRDVDLADGVMIVEAGCVLADVHAAAAAAGRVFPLTLASEGSARIGGLLGTNAGGVNVLRYGNARDLCLGVEAVMADGSVMHGLRRVAKDNMGYDLRHLLIGSEGTLGLITAASLRLHPRPGETATAWAAVTSPDAALALLNALRDALGGTISAFELIGVEGLAFLAEKMPSVPQPPAMGTDWRVLVEAADAAGAGTRARLEAALMAGLEAGGVAEVLVAQSEAQRAVFWGVRETIPEANRLVGAISSHDISVPPARIGEFVARGAPLVARFDPELRINCFGHLGDGNLHYNVFPPQGRSRALYDSLRAPVKRAVYDLVHELGGSVGAEHGVGRLKVEDLVRYGDPAMVAAMRAIKAALDPQGVLNPGAVLA
ncbi:MAG TPA: FAD-binding oxidoreductase [Amaricoccus sp.]|uniref:FAD-binding oxidoreductase n=1 Tax=Amaricoccus sp. TaxID=1872485 RepID=UPI002C544470|nr:FAD-binding oxidoreductase [Amaricoccus sp.]HRO11520.1 FAD-binding oxidoreductase [Amaricoccus sp.]